MDCCCRWFAEITGYQILQEANDNRRVRPNSSDSNAVLLFNAQAEQLIEARGIGWAGANGQVRDHDL